jgi:VIT1/CCC1 family predicted Fe2+/Mn2+ transporter
MVNQPDHLVRDRLDSVAEDTLPPEDRQTKRQLPELQAVRRTLRRRPTGLRPHVGPVGQEQSAALGKSGTLRAAIFGVNDGLVSNASLIMGFAGATDARDVILLAGVAGLLAGAFSMGAGEYVSMRVQREVLERMLHLEAHELGTELESERAELAELYRKKGLSADLAEQVAEQLMADPETALDTHAREELGIDPQEGLGSPWGAALSSFFTFAAGAFVPLLPFLFVGGTAGTVIAAALTGVALLVVGGLTSRLTGRSTVASALRMFGIGAGAALVTYAIGSLLDVSVAG